MEQEGVLTPSEQRQNKLIESYVTLCCEAPVIRIGRAWYHCEFCEKDVSLEFCLFVECVCKEP